jgi:EPS-associated MarR family transcriptional regulator
MNRNKEKISLEDTCAIFKEIELSGELSQRDFAGKLGYSLGKVNFLLKALVKKGLVKMENFSKSDNKTGYRYILTPKGVGEKYKITADFLKRKEAEFIKMQVEIEELRKALRQAQ